MSEGASRETRYDVYCSALICGGYTTQTYFIFILSYLVRVSTGRRKESLLVTPGSSTRSHHIQTSFLYDRSINFTAQRFQHIFELFFLPFDMNDTF